MTEATRTERRLGPYTLLERVGQGGMGEVHIARRDGANTLCVLKQLRENTEAENLFRLKREAHVLSQLTHPNIARLIDAGVDDLTFYLAIELIPGQTVRRILRRLAEQHHPRFPPEIAIQVAIEVLDGLTYAHEQRDAEGRPMELVHRDLSPNNVMLSYDGRTKIIDFGIASGKLDDFRTTPGMILGTMRYISPEQALSKPVDRRSDLYTLGAVLYEMLTGRPVIQKGEQLEVLDAVLRRRPEPFTVVAPDLSRQLWSVVAKAMDKRASERFESAPAFKAALLDASREYTLPNQDQLGRFLLRWFPEDLQVSAAHFLTPEDQTNSARDDVSATDKSEVSITASEEHQPTQVDRQAKRATSEASGDRSPERAIVLPVLLEMPTAPIPKLTSAQLLPPVRKRRPIALPMAVTFATAMAGLVLALPKPSVEPAPPKSPPPPTIPASATPRAVPAARTPPAAAEAPAIAERPRRQPAKAPAPIALPEAPLPAPVPAPVMQASLRDKLELLRKNPDDVRLMLELHDQIVRTARSLPRATQATIQVEIDAAQRSGDVESMARGLAILERALNE